MKPRIFIGCIAVAVVLGNLLVTMAQTGPGGGTQVYPDMKCITGLNPNKCRGVGNSYCNATAAGGGCPMSGCYYCDSGNWMPTHYCVDWPQEQCEGRTSGLDCDGVARMVGHCDIDGTCVCIDEEPVGNCEETSVLECFQP